MPTKISKARQQEIVADFIYERDLELCMYIYLDIFIDTHRRNYPEDVTTYSTRGIKTLLEASYQMIREQIRATGLLTEKTAGEYMTRSNAF
jgi:hypothetical protein